MALGIKTHNIVGGGLEYRPDIDGLRALAVSSVAAFHFFPELVPGGFIGVDVFFVISGYLISQIIILDLKQGTFRFLDFYARRIRRIFPALLMILFFTGFAGWILLFSDEYSNLNKHIAGGAVFIANILLQMERGYFDTLAFSKPLLHLWSLGIEEQFYLVWPFFMWIGYRLRNHLPWLILSVAGVSFLLNLEVTSDDPVKAFYSPLSRFWELLIGALLAHRNASSLIFGSSAYESKTNRSSVHNQIRPYPLEIGNRVLGEISSVAGLVLIVIGIYVVREESSFPGYWALLPTLGTALLILPGNTPFINRRLFSSRFFVWVGLISYPLYLWHWPLISFARIVTGDQLSQIFRIVLLIMSIALAWLTYVLLEKPFRFGRRKNLKTMALIGLMLIAGIIGYNGYVQNGYPERPVNLMALDLAYKSNKERELLVFPCDENLSERNEGVFCALSKNFPPPKIAIIGDSFADDKFVGLAIEDQARNWQLIGKGGCPPVIGLAVSKGCSTEPETIINYVATHKNLDIVVLSFFGNYFSDTPFNANHKKLKWRVNITSRSDDSIADKRALIKEGLSAAIDRILQSGKRVVVLLPPPELPFFPRDCLRNPFRECRLPRANVEANRAEMVSIVGELQLKYSELRVFDPINVFCDSKECRYMDDSTLYYYDALHLTVRGSKFYAHTFLTWLRAQELTKTVTQSNQ